MVNFVFCIFIASWLFSLSGCSVIMAVKQPDYKDLNVLNKGTPRSRVVAELGAPILTEERESKKVDVFSFKQGYGKGNKTVRALFHAAADVWTFGLWEIIGTPAEGIASGRKIKAEVTYDAKENIEKVDFFGAKK
ncbi:hypothetical protein HZC07_05015 [Candidatus Micrarchaeota archaeon]|nr:hypothetical protein [Candidatus Micrarchaeota archaeon]